MLENSIYQRTFSDAGPDVLQHCGEIIRHATDASGLVDTTNDQTLLPKLYAFRRSDDSDLDSKIRKMSDIDIAQVGIPVEDGMKGKRELAARLAKIVGPKDLFRMNEFERSSTKKTNWML